MKKNVKILAAAGVAAVALVGGTFAYYTSTLTLDNPLDTGKDGSVLVEEFTPPTDDWKPGQSWNKDVYAENPGDYPVLVRIKMDETWSPKADNEAAGRTVGTAYKSMSSKDYDQFMATEDHGQYDAATHAFTANQLKDTDGKVEGDDTVVYKNMENVDPNKWVYGNDGYWYWNGVLDEDGKTEKLLDSLVLATNIDLGHYITTEYYQIAADRPSFDPDSKDGWTIAPWNATKAKLDEDETKSTTEKAAALAAEIMGWTDGSKKGVDGDLSTKLAVSGMKLWRASASELDKTAPGYADSYYTLTVTSEFVQANTDAVAAAWGEEFDSWRKDNLTNIKENETDSNILEQVK